ncbi:MAG: SDR family oxidoreductase [Halofilum sp. (in: g-proteobacteria)]|nr:SDR family oxidoreductase [Halofilum sp. (in: g-proteobacteria)]
MSAGLDLDGRVALVTGASGGIGRSMARALAGAGARVVVSARRRERLDETVAAIGEAGGTARALPADLGALERLDEVAADAIEAFGRVDILVNAAGINLREPVAEVSVEGWRRTIDIHLGTPFFLARALVPGMRERGWGRIINLASLQSLRAFPDSLPYGSAKGGVVQMTRAMAEAWSRDGVNCNAIGPGFVETELTAPVFADEALAGRMAAQTAIGRNGELRDLDGATVFLASPASDYVTGQTLFVDGGFTAR